MFEYFVSTKCYWFIILILSLESDYQMVPRRQQDYFKDNNMVLENSKVEPSLAFKNSLSVSNSDTQEFSLSSSFIEPSLAFENTQSVSNSDTKEFSLPSSFIEPSLAFENTQSVSNSDTQEFSLSSSTLTTTILLEVVNS